MNIVRRLILSLNWIQKGFLTVAASIFIFWLLDGFGVKPLEEIIFRFVNIAFGWSFDTNFGIQNEGYFHPDFIFIMCMC